MTIYGKKIPKVAIDKFDNKYVYPSIANKNSFYKCPWCDEDVLFKNGSIKMKHFSHFPKSKCKYYNQLNNHHSENESEVHKQGKYLLKSIIDNNITLTVKRNNSSDYTIDCKHKCVIEHPFKHNGEQKYADVAILDKNDKILYIFEVFNTHKTKECDRPEPWFEISVKNICKYFSYDYLYCDRNPITLDNMDYAIELIKNNRNDTKLCDRMLNGINNAIEYDLMSYF